MIGLPRTVNAVWQNIEINQPKLVSMCGYILAVNWQNFAEKHGEDIAESFRGLLF